MWEILYEPSTYVSLASLALLEIVLGIDNVIFISILADKLPQEARNKARMIGLMVALVGRLGLLMGISWIVKLTQPLITVMQFSFSGKDLIMLLGGLFLIWKAAQEIYHKVEEAPDAETLKKDTGKAVSFSGIIFQIILIDMVFSLDSIITAIGMVSHIAIMVVAIFISMGVMLTSANHIGGFIDRHPSVKILALSFLLMIGTMLLAEGFHAKIPKEYIYFSLSFALLVEVINIRVRAKNHKKLSV